MIFQSEKLGALTVMRTPGEGAFGITYLVENDGGDRYIVKVLKLQHVDRWKVIERFEREAKALEQLKHPWIPQFYDTIETDEILGIVQEYIRGDTLQDLIDRERLCSQEEWVSWFKQGIDILRYLSSFQPPVIHRDIAPKNMMVTPGGKLYLIDFGGVQTALTENSKTVTTLGTFGYMAPEQIMGRTSPESDLYSFGITMLAVANGLNAHQFPFDGAAGQIDLHQLLKQVPENYRAVLKQICHRAVQQRSLDDVIQRLQTIDHNPETAKDPVRRVDIGALGVDKRYPSSTLEERGELNPDLPMKPVGTLGRFKLYRGDGMVMFEWSGRKQRSWLWYGSVFVMVMMVLMPLLSVLFAIGPIEIVILGGIFITLSLLISKTSRVYIGEDAVQLESGEVKSIKKDEQLMVIGNKIYLGHHQLMMGKDQEVDHLQELVKRLNSWRFDTV